MSDLQYALLLNQVADLAANGLIRFLTSKTIILHRQTLVFFNKNSFKIMGPCFSFTKVALLSSQGSGYTNPYGFPRTNFFRLSTSKTIVLNRIRINQMLYSPPRGNNPISEESIIIEFSASQSSKNDVRSAICIALEPSGRFGCKRSHSIPNVENYHFASSNLGFFNKNSFKIMGPCFSFTKVALLSSQGSGYTNPYGFPRTNFFRLSTSKTIVLTRIRINQMLYSPPRGNNPISE